MRSLPLFLLALVSRPLLKNIVRLSSGHPKDGTEALIFQGPPPRTVPGSSTETGPQVPLLAADWGFQTCPKPAGSCGTCPNSLPDSWGEASGSILLFLYSFEMEPISPKPKTPRIHQTWKTHRLDNKSREWFATWSDKNPTCEHKLWNDTEVAALVQSTSPDLIWPIWQGLLPVERADAFRYIVLWVHGGYYADIDVSCIVPISEMPFPNETDMLFGCPGPFATFSCTCARCKNCLVSRWHYNYPKP